MSMSSDIAMFWEGFGRRCEHLANDIKQHHLRVAFNDVEALLAKSGFDSAFELTRQGNDAVLILTPEGDSDEAVRIDRLLAARPALPGWRFYGRRLQKDPDDALVFVRHIYDVDLNDPHFIVQKVGDKFDVTMLSSALKGMSAEQRRSITTTFLHHAVGEENVMKKVRQIRGTADPVAADALLGMRDAVSALRSA
ncbi:MAG: hypothetical protein JWN02_481 [Acidobacteria bacterium]|nr:hypothetical protein [Acidobacteriota bacterium]